LIISLTRCSVALHQDGCPVCRDQTGRLPTIQSGCRFSCPSMLALSPLFKPSKGNFYGLMILPSIRSTTRENFSADFSSLKTSWYCFEDSVQIGDSRIQLDFCIPTLVSIALAVFSTVVVESRRGTIKDLYAIVAATIMRHILDISKALNVEFA